jgi:hypothetical protein
MPLSWDNLARLLAGSTPTIFAKPFLIKGLNAMPSLLPTSMINDDFGFN